MLGVYCDGLSGSVGVQCRTQGIRCQEGGCLKLFSRTLFGFLSVPGPLAAVGPHRSSSGPLTPACAFRQCLQPCRRELAGKLRLAHTAMWVASLLRTEESLLRPSSDGPHADIQSTPLSVGSRVGAGDGGQREFVGYEQRTGMSDNGAGRSWFFKLHGCSP
ncbi:unnamed protein product [Pleuronectes platessa]|uniref:Uncharacterized protein n=1 Tax=Pleuronectes platessa TaxID=8262 RepID=A0A9N7VNR6_PLEPL|nr:unnamed protein product [Pleuronectes platessa]